jgi:hypothetical protein
MDKEDKAKTATEQMFGLVGRAITQWSFVEQALSNIFIMCVTPCPSKPGPDGHTSFIDSQVPTAIFYSIESFRGKLGLVDAALLARVSDRAAWAEELRVDWARLRDKARKLSLKRNRLAHWTVIPASQHYDVFHEAALLPPFGSPGWWTATGLNPGERLKPLHVEHLCTAFCIIEERLRAFQKRLGQSQGLFDIYDQLTARLIRSHDRLNPTRGERIRRDLASPE